MYFYLSLGSNIQPELSAVTMVKKLCEHFGVLAIYPFRYTEPEAIASAARFVNGLVVIKAEQSASEVKQKLNQVETEMGRDRSDPMRSVKNRCADIDIIAQSSTLDLTLFSVASEGYVRSCLNLQGEAPELSGFGLASHQRPATVYLDTGAGQIRIIEDELQGFIDGLKAPLNG